MNNTIFVTGGSGYIGKHVCQQLASNGYKVLNIDKIKCEIPGVTMCQMDFTNNQIQGMLQLMKPLAVIHLAANHIVPEGETNPSKFYENNVGKTITLLQWIIDAQVKNFIFGSSIAAKDPENVYGTTKRIIEDLLPRYHHAHGLNSICLRFCNVAGADPNGSLGRCKKSPPIHLIPKLIDLVANDKPIPIYGDDYDTPDGTALRDYVHVCDVARAHVNCVEKLQSQDLCEVVELGTGSFHSVLEVIHALEKHMDTELETVLEDRRPGDPDSLHCDTALAESLLGWRAQYDLNSIIEHSVNWYKSNHKRFK